jgi:hypothetical protein
MEGKGGHVPHARAVIVSVIASAAKIGGLAIVAKGLYLQQNGGRQARFRAGIREDCRASGASRLVRQIPQLYVRDGDAERINGFPAESELYITRGFSVHMVLHSGSLSLGRTLGL